MAKVKDCPGFETFGHDITTARETIGLSRRALAEQVNIYQRYLANIELSGDIPSMPVVIQLIKICRLPFARYFNPETVAGISDERQRVSHKLQLCPEKYLPIIEATIESVIKLEE